MGQRHFYPDGHLNVEILVTEIRDFYSDLENKCKDALELARRRAESCIVERTKLSDMQRIIDQSGLPSENVKITKIYELIDRNLKKELYDDDGVVIKVQSDLRDRLSEGLVDVAMYCLNQLLNNPTEGIEYSIIANDTPAPLLTPPYKHIG